MKSSTRANGRRDTMLTNSENRRGCCQLASTSGQEVRPDNARMHTPSIMTRDDSGLDAIS